MCLALHSISDENIKKTLTTNISVILMKNNTTYKIMPGVGTDVDLRMELNRFK